MRLIACQSYQEMHLEKPLARLIKVHFPDVSIDRWRGIDCHILLVQPLQRPARVSSPNVTIRKSQFHYSVLRRKSQSISAIQASVQQEHTKTFASN